jgi:tRNA nucleotidyltransferase (CCA-adding enzyme)
MNPRAHLDNIYRDLVPTEKEIALVQGKINLVVDAASRFTAVAEVRPAGSWAKGTMLRGRKEADVVMVLARAPHSHTLDQIRDHLTGLPGLFGRPTISYKAVNLEFYDGVSVDLLPVAKYGVTDDGNDVPPKLRHALAGIKHVTWLKREAHGAVVHPLIRLMKHFRDCHERDFHGMSSFAIEVMCVEHGATGNIYDAFRGLLESLHGGWLAPGGVRRRLPDPADRRKDVLADLSASALRDVPRRAGGALRAIDAHTWSQVFPKDHSTLPPPASNLGGRTLG